MTSQVPRLEQSFELGKEIGRGGFGVVYRARHRTSGREYAVKLAHQRGSGEQRERILREARLLEGIRAPNLVALEGVFEDAHGCLALVYELVEGEDLDLLRDRIDPDREQLLAWLRDLAEGVDSLHQAGILHRDLKPENMRVEASGRVRILDYGLARWEEKGGTITGTGVILGTPRFMAGEVFVGAPPDRSQDLYSLAAVAYWLIEGEPPFTAEAPTELLAEQARGPLPLQRSRWARAPLLSSILARGLSPEPEDRFGSGRELVEALERFWSSDPGSQQTIALEPPRTTGRKPGNTSRIGALPARPVRLSVLLMGVILGWFALPQEVISPEVVPDPTAIHRGTTGEEGGTSSWGPLGEDFAESLRTELSERAALLDPESGRPVLDRDPLRWYQVIVRWPRLLRYFRWLDRGGRPWELGEDQRADLRRADEWFQGQDLPPPFFPFAYDLTPLPEEAPLPRSLLATLDREEGDPDPPERAGGWFGRSLQLLSAVVETVDLRKDELKEGCPEFLAPKIYLPLTFRSEWDRQALVTVVDGVCSAGNGEQAVVQRRRMRDWFQPASDEFPRFLFAFRRTMEEEPEHVEELAVLTVRSMGWLKPLLYAAQGTTPVSWWFPGPPVHPAAELVYGCLAKLQREHSFLPPFPEDPEPRWLWGATRKTRDTTGWSLLRRELALTHLAESYLGRNMRAELEVLVREVRPEFRQVREDLRRRLIFALTSGVISRGRESELGSEELEWLAQALRELQATFGREAIRDQAAESMLPALERMIQARSGGG